MKRYVVNLDRSKERMAWFARQAAAQRVDFTRVPAVDGRNLTVGELASYHARCPPRRSISFGELGCFLSHVRIWKRMVAERTPWAFIAEDDLHFGCDAETFLGRDDWLPPAVDVIKAETLFTRVELSAAALAVPLGHALRGLRSFHGGSAGYFVSLGGASRLLAFSEVHCEPLDHFIFGQSHRTGHGLVIAQLDPAICVQDDQLPNGVGLTSDLDVERDDFLRHHPLSRRPRGARRIVRELRRLAGYMWGPVRRLALTAAGTSIFAPVPITLEGRTVAERRRKPHPESVLRAAE